MASEKITNNFRNRFCSVPQCGINKRLMPEIGFFILPKNPERSQLWLNQIGKTNPLGPVYVCENHFEKDLIIKNLAGKRKLKTSAIPTLKIPTEAAISEQASGTENQESCLEVGTETLPLPFNENEATDDLKTNDYPDEYVEIVTKEDENYTTQSRKYKSAKRTQAQDKAIKTNTSLLVPNEEIPGMAKGASFFNLKVHSIQTRMQQLLDTNKMHNYKQLSLKLYLRFPKAYIQLQKALTVAPKAELKDVFKNTIISTEKVTTFPVFLKHKANTMTVKQKQCIICIGEKKIKPRIYYDIRRDHLLGIQDVNDVLRPESATTAVVLIAQGIFEDWKQPVGVSYLGNNQPSIKLWIDRNIKNLFDIGFNVRAIVSSIDSSHFTNQSHVFNVNKKKIYIIHDISSLFTSFYYNFTKHDYYFDSGSIIKYQHIVDYFESDSKKQMPLTPKLTEKHIKPTNLRELNIKSVMEVLSLNTAAAISAYIDFKVLDESAENVVLLITKMRTLYDLLSTGRFYDESNSKMMFTDDETPSTFLLEMIALFNKMQIDFNRSNLQTEPANFLCILHDSHIKLMNKFEMTIKSILTLSENLKFEKYEDLFVCKFNTHAAESFFEQVEKHSKSITKPSARDVDSIFRQTAIINLLKYPVKGTPVQMEDVLTQFDIIINGFKPFEDLASPDPNATDFIGSSEYNALELERKNGLIFLAGFLLKRCTYIHSCDKLKNYNCKVASNVEALSMCESIMADVRNDICILPSPEFVEFVESMEILFRTFMNKEILCTVNKKFLNSLLKSLELARIPLLCKCFPVYYVKKLYARFRIYHTLKYNNELIRTKRTKRIVVNKL